MASAARAARSEQTAQAPGPRRVACDPDRPVAIPRDPDRDIALKDDEQKVLKAILSLAFEDRRTPGVRRWCCWASNDTILHAINLMGEEKEHNYFDRAFRRLREKGRVLRKNMTEFGRWLVEEAPRHGMSCDRPPLLRKHRGRVIIIVAELPPVVSEAYGPLKVPPPEEPSELLNVRSSIPQPEEPELLNVRSSNRREIPMDLPEYGSNPSSTCVCEPPTTIDDGVDQVREEDPYRAELLSRIEADPRNAFWRMALRSYDAPPPPSPRRPTTFVENPAAGRERDPLPSTAAQTIPFPSGPEDAADGRIGRPLAGSLADEVLAVSDAAGAIDLADRLLAAMKADDDDDLGAVCRRAMLGVVASPPTSSRDAIADAIRQLANPLKSPRGFLRGRMDSARKKPAAGHTRQSGTGGGSYPI